MADVDSELHVQVCYATPEHQVLKDLSVPVGTSVHRAILQSGMLQSTPEIDLSVLRVGIYGKLKNLDTLLNDGDRVEIYRPLIADPKDSRRKRAEKKDKKIGPA
jgi:putative ubiquitin-RnfH superfamily antitoxin RatB of RatAB toxin-antitoxin module